MLYDIKLALANGEFFPFYQPIVCSLTDKIIGAEVLARWVHPAQGVVMPGVFLPLIEHEELIIELTLSLMSKVACDLDGSAEPDFAGFYVSFNVTSDMIDNDFFFESLIKYAAEMGRKNIKVMVEFIERYHLNMTGALQERITFLKDNGIEIALDDFGTGCSNFSFLEIMAPDCIKIDRSFTSGLGINKVSEAIISTIINLSNKLNITVVSEGVENEKQLAMLNNMNANFIQGYYYSRPLPNNEFKDYICNFKATH